MDEYRSTLYFIIYFTFLIMHFPDNDVYTSAYPSVYKNILSYSFETFWKLEKDI
jgi:hypothetical protein